MARSDDAATTSSSGGSGSGSATSGTTGTLTKSASSTASVASRSLLSIRRSSLFNNKTSSKTTVQNAAAASDLSLTGRAAAAAGSPASPVSPNTEAEAARSGTLTTSASGAGFAFGLSLRRRSSTTSSPINAPHRVELPHRPKTSSPSPVATPLNSWNTIFTHGPHPVGATAADAPRQSTPTARTRSMSPNEPTGPAMTNHRMQQDLTTTFAPSFAASSSLLSSNAHAHALVNQPSFIHPHTASALVHDPHSSTATLPKAANKQQHPPSSNWATSPRAATSATPEPSTPTGAMSSSAFNGMSTNNNTSNKPLVAQINTASRSPLPSASGPSPLSATKSSALAPMTTTATRPVPNSSSSSRRGEPTLPRGKVARAPATSMYWSRTPVSGRLPRPMRAHTAVVVDTSIYCFGGCDLKGVCFRDVWKLDGDSFLWSKVKVLGDIPPVTRAHTSTVVGSRIWVIAGGDGPNYSNSVYFFETTSHEWFRPKVYGPAPTKRRAHAAVLYGSLIIIFGGGNGSPFLRRVQNALQDVHSLDVSNHYRPTWSELQVRGPKPVRRGYHSMTLVGSKAIVFGGSDGTECFSDMFVLDLEGLTWTEIIPEFPAPVAPAKATSNVGPPPRTEAFPRLSHSATLLGSYLVIFGGHDGIDFSNELLFFNLVSLQWEPRSAHGHAPSPRGYHTCVLHDSRLLCIGGFDGKQVFDECYSLDLGALAFLPQVTQFKLDVYSDQEE
ncbi:BZ3500_MvSof-1268-A1-R1_Chr3-1g06047 [Microbotryum saponariae]|uniref:BZ3500_MvSof-1268-A1-R1_Chr3-1g06047 protein n=1 Tax=Microbotryum saponariae TaxID=289078 RepID=A0A2X0L4W1_9BASI|nr:BZ3500_MvSof-1268-A1-R1_Chr3-1g06047 [Microbotryum saponariae]SDA03861.1 BZ3501_MvSof-1269-A2-R1_Chr3-2g05732 [Microbotryum saponariae]